MNFKEVFKGFNQKNVLIVGDAMIDAYMWGNIHRNSPEAPVPVIKPLREVYSKGMAENVELNLKSLDVDTQLICNSEEVVKIRYVDNSYNYILLRIDENDKVSPLKLTELPNLDDFDLVVFADYNKGFLSKSDILEISSKCNCPTFLDTKKKLGSWSTWCTYIKINHYEYERSLPFQDAELEKKIIPYLATTKCFLE